MAFGSESEGSDSVSSFAKTATSGGYCLLQTPSESKKQHACMFEGCSAKFSRPYRLKAHFAKHYGIKPFVCPHGGCGRAYASKMHLKRHFDTSHDTAESTATETVYPCSFEGCSAVFKFKQNERRHYKRNHVLKTCKDCGLSFKKTSQMKKHTSHHDGTPLFCCDLCKERFYTKVELRRHMNRSHRVHFCQVKDCYEAFWTWSAVRKHMKVHPRVLECYHCGKKFRLRKALQMHVNKHLESPDGLIKRKPPARKLFECATCGQQFVGGKASLLRHIKVQHLGEPSKQRRLPKTGPRAIRKDKGSAKNSMAAKLSSVVLEPTVEKELVKSLDMDVQNEPLVSSVDSLCQAIVTNVVREISDEVL